MNKNKDNKNSLLLMEELCDEIIIDINKSLSIVENIKINNKCFHKNLIDNLKSSSGRIKKDIKTLQNN